jgi:hypothetical protein
VVTSTPETARGCRSDLADRLSHRGLAARPRVGVHPRGALGIHRDHELDAARHADRDGAYDLSRDPLQLLNVAETPAHAARVAHTAARFRALRPGWPFDACGSDIDSDE